MLKYFLESRKAHRVWNRPASQLAQRAECSLIMAQEVQWGLYDPMPPKFESILDITRYNGYRKETRRQFGEAFDFPVFTTFTALSDYFSCSFQEVAKAFCLQRSLMQLHDKARIQNQSFYRTEILSAFVQSIGPDYAFDIRNGLVSPVALATATNPPGCAVPKLTVPSASR